MVWRTGRSGGRKSYAQDVLLHKKGINKNEKERHKANAIEYAKEVILCALLVAV